MNPSVFTHTSYKSFLTEIYRSKRQKNGRFSFGSWASQMGVSNTAVLTRIINGDRHPSEETQLRICKSLGFDDAQREYFKYLVLLEKNLNDPSMEILIKGKLKALHPSKKFNFLGHDAFMAMANWYYFVIYEMVALADFNESPTEIQKRLRFEITLPQIKDAIRTLSKLGLIERDLKTKKLRQSLDNPEFASDYASEASKRNHEDNLKLALRAIREVERAEREFNAACFNLKTEDLPALKKDIVTFKNEMIKKYASPQGEETYQLQLQLFPYTKPTGETQP